MVWVNECLEEWKALLNRQPPASPPKKNLTNKKRDRATCFRDSTASPLL